MSRMTALAALTLLVCVTALTVGTASAIVETGSVPAAAQTDSPAPDVSMIPNTTNYLSIEAPERRSYVESDVDVVAASGISADQLHARHANRTFDQRFAEADAASFDRLDLVRQAARRGESRVEAIETRQTALFEAYNNGTLSRETFLRRVGRLSARAQLTGGELRYVNRQVDSSLEVTMPGELDTRLTGLQKRLVTLPDPVTDRIRAGLSGERDPATVYVEGADSDLVLATVDSGEFVRQAMLRSDYAPGQADRFNQPGQRRLTLALERGSDLYGWAYDNAIGAPLIRGFGFGEAPVYLVSIDHPQGALRSYISGGTTNAFYEIQRQRPAAVPVTDEVSATSDEHTLSVETTSPTGPMRVTLTGPSSNTPINGTVDINGQVVGQTGSNGQLVTVRPSGDVQLNATADGDTVGISLS